MKPEEAVQIIGGQIRLHGRNMPESARRRGPRSVEAGFLTLTARRAIEPGLAARFASKAGSVAGH
ncbi:MAG TPA: hypothetical protein VGP18_11045 [Solirubrobacteraceae bacterium]|jgi:hypothetical protein|nr:hypothetical protein [Solirubrobacteraceae bacterium]